MPAPSTAKTAGLIAKLVESGEFYSAHLKTRSTVARLVKQHPTEFDVKAQEAAQLLFQTAQALLEKAQTGSGTDLSLYLIDVWSTHGVVCSESERSASRPAALRPSAALPI